TETDDLRGLKRTQEGEATQANRRKEPHCSAAFLQQHGVYAGMSRPHLVILDIGLPKLSGWKRLPTLGPTPALATRAVVMLTGARMKADDAPRAAWRPWGFFVKPLLLAEYQPLVEQLERLLSVLPCHQ